MKGQPGLGIGSNDQAGVRFANPEEAAREEAGSKISRIQRPRIQDVENGMKGIKVAPKLRGSGEWLGGLGPVRFQLRHVAVSYERIRSSRSDSGRLLYTTAGPETTAGRWE